MKTVKIGIVGIGAISNIYLENIQKMFHETDVLGVYDLVLERAAAAVEKYGIPKLYPSLDALLADSEVELVLNLTRPSEHFTVSQAALLAGKSVYSEKPLAATLEEGQELVRLAAERNLAIGCAPDTFLGAGIQTCRRLIDDGYIGKVLGCRATMLCHGHETWHPDPAFYYHVGGGPMMDMGPYYLTALINLMGPVREVMGMTGRGFDTRTVTSTPRFGEVIDVETDTHINGLMRFTNGALGTITTSFDVFGDECCIEIFGTEGTLSVPDPNGFGGPVRLRTRHDNTYREIPLLFGYETNSRGLGLADMAKSLAHSRRPRANADQALHVLEIMTAFGQSSRLGRKLNIHSRFKREAPMPNTLPKGILD